MADKPRDQFKAEDKTLPFKGPEAIEAEILACFAYEYAGTPSGQAMEIVTTTEEFTELIYNINGNWSGALRVGAEEKRLC